MSDYETVLVTHHGQVAVVSLNRPDNLNAFDSQLLRELSEVVAQVNDDDNIRVAILTGEGRAFSAGADLAQDMVPGFKVEDVINSGYKPVLMAITGAPQPWISAVNGAAAGVASAFAMACDLTVMAEDAYIYQAFAAIGLIPDGGATWHLVHTLGRKRAYELIVSGEKIRAEKCLALGLCNRVVASDTLLDETLAWAQELAVKAPLSLRYTKHALNSAMAASLADTISDEGALQQLCFNSEDFGEGVVAFLEKREPHWAGK